MAANPPIKEEIFAFRPQDKGAWFETYKASTNFTGKLTSTSALDTYEKNRAKNIDGFNSVKTPDGKTITEKLRGSESANEISEIFKSADLDKARAEFKEDMENLNQRISGAKPPALNFSPGQVGVYLLDRRDEIVKIINNQHNEAKAKLTDLFEKPDFRSKFQKTIPDGNIETIKDEMLATLDKTKTDELTKFEKALGDNANELFIASKNEFERLSYISRKYFESDMMKAAIDKQIAESKDLKGEGASVSANFDEGTAFFKNVDVNKLQLMDTMQHGWISYFDRKIQHEGNGFHMELNRMYQSKDSIRMEIASLGQTMKACGYDSVELNIQNKDPKKQKNMHELPMRRCVLQVLTLKKSLSK